eukprot:3529112-Prymnesium_polylepis.1
MLRGHLRVRDRRAAAAAGDARRAQRGGQVRVPDGVQGGRQRAVPVGHARLGTAHLPGRAADLPAHRIRDARRHAL